jgi:hypothetical protein
VTSRLEPDLEQSKALPNCEQLGDILRQIQAMGLSSTLLPARLVREHQAGYDKERQRRPALPHLPRSSLGALAVVIRSVLNGILPPDNQLLTPKTYRLGGGIGATIVDRSPGLRDRCQRAPRWRRISLHLTTPSCRVE